tara:strand:+ start:101 stop:535 length:435 start_codon:yes stop_codon:yes gene_type:complete
MTNYQNVKDFKILTMLKQIKKLVENYYNIQDISVKNRRPKFVEARVVYSIIVRQNSNYTLSEIGNLINRDHSSICHYNEKIYDSWISFPKFNIDKLQSIQIIYNNFIEQNSHKAEFYNVAIDDKSSNEKKSLSKIFRQRRYFAK